MVKKARKKLIQIETRLKEEDRGQQTYVTMLNRLTQKSNGAISTETVDYKAEIGGHQS